jgi:hypothetical protein
VISSFINAALAWAAHSLGSEQYEYPGDFARLCRSRDERALLAFGSDSEQKCYIVHNQHGRQFALQACANFLPCVQVKDVFDQVLKTSLTLAQAQLTQQQSALAKRLHLYALSVFSVAGPRFGLRNGFAVASICIAIWKIDKLQSCRPSPSLMSVSKPEIDSAASLFQETFGLVNHRQLNPSRGAKFFGASTETMSISLLRLILVELIVTG